MQKKATSRFDPGGNFESGTRNRDGLNSRSKAPRLKSNRSRNTNVATKAKKRLEAKIEAKFSIVDGRVILDLPLRTKSEANIWEKWPVRHARHQEQKRMVALALTPFRQNIKLPCKIMLTRFAPDSLDKFDNLPVSFKYIVDAICAIITGDYRPGRADGDQRISIMCDQIMSKEYGVRIEIFSELD